MDSAKVVRLASEGEKGEAMSLALQQGILSVDAQRDYADMLKRYDVLEHQKARLENEIRYLQGCLGLERDSNRRFRQIYRNALADKEPKPTRRDRVMSSIVTVATAAIVTMTAMLGYLIVRYCL